MRSSETLNEFAGALAKAQGEMENAILNKVNPHFKSKYADLAAIRDAIIPSLAKHGIAMIQAIDSDDTGPFLTTRLVHSSGQWVESVYPLPANAKPQEFGSALTYGKRYSLASLCGISADEDDDANEANTVDVSGRNRAPVQSNGAKTAAPNGKSGKTTTADWAGAQMEKVNTFKTAAELKAWKSENQALLDALATKDPKASNVLDDLINDRLDRMSVLQAG
jgi:hypothetical protein